MKRILLFLLAGLWSVSCFGAEPGGDSGAGYGPKRGNVTLGLTLGYNGYVGLSAPTLMAGAADYELSALEALSNLSPLGVGLDGNWYVTDRWALRFGGGFAYSYKPGYTSVPAVTDDDPTGEDPVIVPGYRAVGNASVLQWQVNLGMNRYWSMPRVPALRFYCGALLGFSYGMNQIRYDEESSMGTSVSEVSTARVGFAAGAEYWVLPGMYVGLDVQPVQYCYSLSSLRPQEGMKPLRADSHNIGVLSTPTFRLGFMF